MGRKCHPLFTLNNRVFFIAHIETTHPRRVQTPSGQSNKSWSDAGIGSLGSFLWRIQPTKIHKYHCLDCFKSNLGAVSSFDSCPSFMMIFSIFLPESTDIFLPSTASVLGDDRCVFFVFWRLPETGWLGISLNDSRKQNRIKFCEIFVFHVRLSISRVLPAKNCTVWRIFPANNTRGGKKQVRSTTTQWHWQIKVYRDSLQKM